MKSHLSSSFLEHCFFFTLPRRKILPSSSAAIRIQDKASAWRHYLTLMSALSPFSPNPGKRTSWRRERRDRGIKAVMGGSVFHPSPQKLLGAGVDSLRRRMSRRLVVYRQTTIANGVDSNPIPPQQFHGIVFFIGAFVFCPSLLIAVRAHKRQQMTGSLAFMHFPTELLRRAGGGKPRVLRQRMLIGASEMSGLNR
ncbi:hypothetical protein CEXT_665131 [Caerostris extrusa]|uniref:Transmembrane protein n=1 Tax=Caerostris extrusa TaxID=172846 RepID=A0AAV4RKQ6_CAEEX|nr:hypothetical protein CEXT_665131 [Caerostris extrusa]